MTEQNNAPLGANGAARPFEPPLHLRELAQEPRRFGYGEGVYEEDTGASWPAETEDDDEEEIEDGLSWEEMRWREKALEMALQGSHGDHHHELLIARAEAFHAFLTGKKAAD